jgi:Domain of unknown function (DUF5348)
MCEDYEPTDGELRRDSHKRWMLNDIELTSGSFFQVKIQDHWIDIVIEHDHTGYFNLPYSVRLLEGLHARFPNQWGD